MKVSSPLRRHGRNMNRHKPLRLYLILAGLSLPVIWLPVIQQLMENTEPIFDLQTWLILSILASIGIIFLFLILFALAKHRHR